MNWNELLASDRVQKHKTNQEEINALKAVVDRDLQDAAVPALSADRRFATAYNAMLQLAKIVIAISGYRVLARTGHHATSIDALKIAMGKDVEGTAAYLDLCRRKRNIIEYNHADIISETEAHEVLAKAAELRDRVEKWIKTNGN